MKTTIRIDPTLWESVKRAARSWAEGEGLSPDRYTTAWVTRALRRAVAEQDRKAAGGAVPP